MAEKNINEEIKNKIYSIEKSKMINNISLSKSTIDTLIFFCFGVTLDDNCDIILDALIEKAYKDATLMGAFNTRVEESKKVNIPRTKDKGKKIIKEWLQEEKIFGEKWHENVINKLLKKPDGCFSTIKEFTMGNTQKWINMVLKYIYLLSQLSNYYSNEKDCLVNEEFKKIADEVNKNASELHVPIDSFMIDAFAFANIPLGDAKINTDLKTRPSEQCIYKWSTIGKEDNKLNYDDIQNEVKKKSDEKKMSRIEWEEQAWILISKWQRDKKKEVKKV